MISRQRLGKVMHVRSHAVVATTYSLPCECACSLVLYNYVMLHDVK